MLLVHTPELDAHHTNARYFDAFGKMDIRELVKSEGSHDSDIGLPHMMNRNPSLSHTHMSSAYAVPSALSLPPPTATAVATNATSTSDPSNFSSTAPLIWSNHGGYYIQAPQPQPPPIIHSQALPLSQNHQGVDWPKGVLQNKRGPSPTDGEEGPPAKKSSTKWNVEENKLIIALRGQGMKWSDISRRIPGRTELACRLHYQNYLEKRGDWDEERKNKLARVYERMKEEMWKPVAAELGIPWRTAEGMHWIIGEQEMARRANVHPFSATIQPSSSSINTSMTPPAIQARPSYFGQRYPDTGAASDDQSAYSFKPPARPSSVAGPPSGVLSAPIVATAGPPTQTITRRALLPTNVYVGAVQHHIQERESETIFLDANSSTSISPSLYTHLNEINPGGIDNGPPALLPSIAELEGGVSPFATNSGRKGSFSSGTSSVRSSAGKSSPYSKTLSASQNRNRPK